MINKLVELTRIAKPLPIGKCNHCGRVFDQNKPKLGAIFCNRRCAQRFFGMPCQSTLEHWVDNGNAKATDGCRVEPDGTCEHGKESWLLVLNMI